MKKTTSTLLVTIFAFSALYSGCAHKKTETTDAAPVTTTETQNSITDTHNNTPHDATDAQHSTKKKKSKKHRRTHSATTESSPHDGRANHH